MSTFNNVTGLLPKGARNDGAGSTAGGGPGGAASQPGRRPPRPNNLVTSPGLRRAAGRLLTAVGVVWAAATFTFLIQALLPGDRATLLLNQLAGQVQQRTAAELAPINAKYGFDDPLIVQYFRFLADLATGNLGVSYQLHKPVTEVIGDQVGPTIGLTFASLLVAWLISAVVIVGTARRSRAVSSVASGLEAVAAGLPQYWLGVILLVVFALNLGWFPVVGGSGLAGLVLPALTLGIPLAGFLGQVTRTEFEKGMDQPFALSARMRGMGDTGVRLRHVLRHSVLPGVTLSGWALGSLFSGAVIAESIFSRPGLGKVLVTAVNSRDLPVVCGIVILIAAIYVLANLLVDIAYTLIDPRLKNS
ncbi:ABC transporter permease [Arthrobacter sp. CAU 1506]|uniref:ABC transporter permease n=1 Tax=Arthrobacter sp. CAU 1506 TaxID=2560052 RepID=UPI0010ADA2B2|nr:ABC transporter permease [Arthrobacter sp. CAU 1506]TJY66355.1 ABC transporter permease [Arthrobacter sp. CAU 1506]